MAHLPASITITITGRYVSVSVFVSAVLSCAVAGVSGRLHRWVARLSAGFLTLQRKWLVRTFAVVGRVLDLDSELADVIA